jgi:prepilin-type N-terminal cleavage/methylation domain-containing protein
MKRRSGFTLLEMILVVAVIAAMAAMAYPTMSGWFRGETLRSAADTVRTAVAMARHMAIEEGEPYRLAIVDGMGNLRAAPDRDDAWSGAIDPSEEFEDTLPEGVILKADSGSEDAPADFLS